MKLVKADFAPEGLVLRYPVVAACLVLLGYGVTQAMEAINLARAVQVLQAQQEFDARITATPMPPHRLVDKPYADNAMHYSRMGEVDFGATLESVESVRLEGANLTAIEIDIPTGQARIELSIHKPADLLKFVQSLNADKSAHEQWAVVRVQEGGREGRSSAVLVSRPPRRYAQ